MKRIPHSAEVVRAFKNLKGTVKTAWKSVNRAAGKVVAKGNYPAGEALTARGRKVKEFLGSIDALEREWRALAKGTADTSRKDGNTTKLPQWEYYQPLLQALVELGGEATKPQLESVIERSLSSRWQAADREALSGGRERWKLMVHRAREHLRTEGWIQDGGGPTWRITPEGRRAATARPTPPNGSRGPSAS